MWFPKIKILISSSLIPKSRKQEITPDKVIQEYLQVKALLSYVGDLVSPYNIPKNTGKFSRNLRSNAGDKNGQNTAEIDKIKKDFFVAGVTGGVTERLGGVTSIAVYEDAKSDVLDLWEPLTGK